MIMTENKWFIAYNISNNIFHYGFAKKGTTFITGQPDVEFFADKALWIARLDELGVEHEETILTEGLEELKLEYLSKLPTIRDKKREYGKFVPSIGNIFHIDKNSISDLSLRVLGFNVENMPNEAPFPVWKTMDGFITDWTFGEAKATILELTEYVQSLYIAENSTANVIASATDVNVLIMETPENIYDEELKKLLN